MTKEAEDFKVTMACFGGVLWMIGAKERISGNDYLVEPYLFSMGNGQIQISKPPGANKETKISLLDCLFSYVVEDQAIEDLYLEATTGIKPMRAPLVTPPRGGNGPRLVQ